MIGNAYTNAIQSSVTIHGTHYSLVDNNVMWNSRKGLSNITFLLKIDEHYARGDSMISTFHGTPLARWQGVCDIDRVEFRVTQKNFKITENSSRTKLNRF